MRYQHQSHDQQTYILVLSHRFQTELGYDFLEIHDGPNLLSPLVGSFNGTQVPQFLFSSSNFLYLLFTTDNSRSNAGFKILYESKSETNTAYLYICTCGHALINPRYHPPCLSIYRSENAHNIYWLYRETTNIYYLTTLTVSRRDIRTQHHTSIPPGTLSQVEQVIYLWKTNNCECTTWHFVCQYKPSEF